MEARKPAAGSPPPLARAGIDRAAEERADPDLLYRLRADRATRVVAVHGDRTLLAADQTLRTIAVQAVREGVEWGFLGRDAEGRGVLLAAASGSDASPLTPAAADIWGAL
ncbi:MAG: NADH pyrophosphatase, partial [Microbacterium sp.]